MAQIENNLVKFTTPEGLIQYATAMVQDITLVGAPYDLDCCDSEEQYQKVAVSITGEDKTTPNYILFYSEACALRDLWEVHKKLHNSDLIADSDPPFQSTAEVIDDVLVFDNRHRRFNIKNIHKITRSTIETDGMATLIVREYHDPEHTTCNIDSREADIVMKMWNDYLQTRGLDVQ